MDNVIRKRLECAEGPEAFRRFDKSISKILTVSHSELAEREREYKQKAAANPHKRGPKPRKKVKPSA